ncbi:MAG: hypothetical protein PHV63_00695 [Candidatus Daviesbacteria bacterium]|nr:hypothetical protein [Candidatus Daviesbacteria bacterium]
MVVEYGLHGSWAERQKQTTGVVEPGNTLTIYISENRILHILCDGEDNGGRIFVSEPNTVELRASLTPRGPLVGICGLRAKMELDRMCSAEIRDGGEVVATIKHVPSQR